MAVEVTNGDLLGGYKVGLISACLSSKSEKENKNKEKSSKSLFGQSNITQPNFKPVIKKKAKKSSDSEEQGENSQAEAKIKKTKRTETKQKPASRKERKLPLNKSADDNPERLSRTLFVGNLPISTSRKDLKKFFRKYGEIESTRLRSVAVPDLQTSKKLAAIKKTFNPNRNNVNGYIVFKSKVTAEKALLSNGTVIGDHCIRVDKVDDSGKQYDHKRSVFVGNLVFDIKEAALGDFFAMCGEVQSVRIIRDGVTGIGKGFGYVLFKNSSSISLALKMNHSELCGRKIRVQPSQENPKTTKGGAAKRGTSSKSFSGIQAKEKYYHKRKVLKQHKKFGLSSTKRSKQTKANKPQNRTALSRTKRKSDKI